MLISIGVPAAHPYAAARLGLATAYSLGSAIALACGIGALVFWPRPVAAEPSDRVRPLWLAAGALAAFACCYWTASRLLPAIFIGPVDVYRGDMLVLVESGVKEFLAGRTPYRIVPPAMGRPPFVWAGPVAAVRAANRRAIRPARSLARGLPLCRRGLPGGVGADRCLGAVSLRPFRSPCWPSRSRSQPQIAAFYPIAHTPVYWPLLIVFCLALTAERWVAAAALLGLLIAARTTMVSIAPVFLLAAYHRQRLTARVVIVLLLTAAGPFVPFLVWDAPAVLYGMVGVYPHTIKEFIWRQTDRALMTYGVTAPLLRHGLERYLEAIQVLACWPSTRRRGGLWPAAPGRNRGWLWPCSSSA